MGFDYLRDNMALFSSELVQRGHAFAIVDEVDSILIDEARTPLIISGIGQKSTEMYSRTEALVARFRKKVIAETDEKEEEDVNVDADYIVDEKGQDRDAHRPRHRQGRAVFRDREPLRSRKLHHRPPHQPGHQGARHDEARHRLRRQGR